MLNKSEYIGIYCSATNYFVQPKNSNNHSHSHSMKDLNLFDIYIYSILEVQILCKGFKRLSPPNMNLMAGMRSIIHLNNDLVGPENRI
jgi:hypothetical protein